jgi:hypothetical protein
MAMPEHVILSDSGITIVDLQVKRRDVADFLRTLTPDEVETSLVRAIEVGVFCLDRARMSQDTEFVRRQVEALLSRVEAAVAKIPDTTQKAFLEKIGTNDGQVLFPVKAMIDTASKVTSEKVKEVRKLLEDEIDPGKENTTLGSALKTLRQLLDPKRTDSVQSAVEQAVRGVTGKEGALAKAVKEVVAETIKPLEVEVDKLTKEVRGQEAAEEALSQTTKKGETYEEEVVDSLGKWAELTGAEISHVGADNRPGDVLVIAPPNGTFPAPLAIIVEAKDTQSALGRKVLSDTLDRAMAERRANAAVYVARNRKGLARELGDWAEGSTEHGPFVACTNANLLIALRWLIIQKRLAETRAAAAQVDAPAIDAQIRRMRTSLERVRAINRQAGNVREGIDGIQSEAEALRDELRDSLFAIEEAMRAVAGKPETKATAGGSV